ncbi:hypothetical protein ACFL03_14340 [Thermodesulfobacteriota bacterium]
MKFSIGGIEHEKIEVELVCYEREPTGEYYDDNWVRGNVFISVGGFKGNYGAAFLTDEFSRFLDELQNLYKSLKGTAEFKTIEEQLYIKASGDGKGHISIEGEALDGAGIGNRLNFNLEIHQTDLSSTINQLKKLVKYYPVRIA